MEVEATSTLQVNGRQLGMVNQTGIPDTIIQGDASMREVAQQVSRWIDNSRAAAGRTSMFDRGTFTPPENPYDEMRVARSALRYDSIVSGVAEVTESFAFHGVKWEGEDVDEADVFNQISRDINLDEVVRQMWREEFLYGQFVCAKVWGWKTYTVRGKTKSGNKRKKSYRVWAPLQLSILDSCKVVPVNTGPLGGTKLAWQATKGEIGHYSAAYAGDVIDPLMVTFFQGTYQPDAEESSELAQLGVDTSKLLLMNDQYVFRHTLTKPPYERFPEIRLKSIFSLLDLKRQLMNADRAALIGAANYILLIRKGDKDAPAQAEEIMNLKENYNFIAKMPVIISDHRLSIDIIAPKTDFTLDGDKYDVLDQRILARLLGTLTLSGKGQRNETQGTLSTVVARVMENRRHMLKRSLEKEFARQIVEHPKNKGVFEHEPNLVYTPRNIALGMDQGYTQALLALRTQREISRETILEHFGMDQATEAQRMEIEEDYFDDIFKTEIPFSAATPAVPGGGQPAEPPKKQATPNGTPEAPGVSGARGGRPAGGGTSKQSPQAQAKPKTAGGNPKTGGN